MVRSLLYSEELVFKNSIDQVNNDYTYVNNNNKHFVHTRPLCFIIPVNILSRYKR